MYKAMAKTGIYTMTAEAFQEKYPDETYVYSMFAGAATESPCTGYKRTIVK